MVSLTAVSTAERARQAGGPRNRRGGSGPAYSQHRVRVRLHGRSRAEHPVQVGPSGVVVLEVGLGRETTF